MDSTTVNLSHDRMIKTMKYHFNLKNALDAFDLNQLLQQIVFQKVDISVIIAYFMCQNFTLQLK